VCAEDRFAQIEDICLKRHIRGHRESLFIDPEFAEALYEDKSDNTSSKRQAQQKTEQFCRQVQRALNLAIVNLQLGDRIEGCTSKKFRRLRIAGTFWCTCSFRRIIRWPIP
jgi:hypothetical protein